MARDSLVDALVTRIRDDILTLRYPPGSMLPAERELAAGYGVTRTTLKHALVRLAQAGLVETRHGVGTAVLDYRRRGGPELLPLLLSHSLNDPAGPDVGWLDEIFEVRADIGTRITALAAQRRTAADLQKLHDQHAAVGAAPDADSAQIAESELHRMLAEASGNRVYVLMVNSLMHTYLEVRYLFQAPFVDPVAAGHRLTPLLAAVSAGDATAARAAAARYLEQTRRLMLGEI
ncbi:FadR/GntR family transcriptional regulator [Catellatospora aurea]|uniref:FadR/GntR family transcriptional regulator n=1 Tax=Catellatospora aurea TaxID=1337874 RepID=A0ABW2H6A6_9ACTN